MNGLDKARLWIATLLLIQAYVRVVGGKIVVTNQLMDHLFSDYNSQLFPACEVGQSVNISMDIALRQIINLDEKEQVITTNVWMRMSWNDCRLEWNATEHMPGRLTVPYTTVWSPDLTLYDSSSEEVAMPGKELYNARITSDGHVVYNFPTVLKSVCKVHVTHFPFDKQTCRLKFGSWTYALEDIDVYSVNPTGDLSSYIANNEWEVVDLPAERVVLKYDEGSYPVIRYYVNLKRRPAFYTMTMLFPCILTSAVALTGFLLPCESGEKVSLEVTVLLSMAVFLLVISEFLPPSTDAFPIIGAYFAASMILVSFSLLLSILTLNVHNRGDNGRVPDWIRTIFLEKRCSCPDKKTVFEAQQESSYKMTNAQTDSNNAVVQVLQEHSRLLKSIDNSLTDRDKRNAISEEWQQLARVLDRTFLVIYLLTSAAVTIVMWIQLMDES